MVEEAHVNSEANPELQGHALLPPVAVRKAADVAVDGMPGGSLSAELAARGYLAVGTPKGGRAAMGGYKASRRLYVCHQLDEGSRPIGGASPTDGQRGQVG